MTTHDRDKIIAAAKEAGFPEWENTDDPEFLKVIEKLYVVAFQSGAASRDAEIADLLEANRIACEDLVEQQNLRVKYAGQIAELVAALEHILAGSLSLPRFAEAEAIAVIASVKAEQQRKMMECAAKIGGNEK